MESKSLLGDMKSIFGVSFGGKPLAVENIQGEIALSLNEAKPRPMPPGRQDFRGREKMQAALSQHAEKRKNQRAQKREASKSSKSGELQQALKMLKQIMKHGDDKGGGQPPTPKGHGRAAGGGGDGGGGGGGGAPGGSGGHTTHNPFRNSPNLGKGPGSPPGHPEVRGKVYHDQVKCWKCSCGDIYKDGCRCTGTGASDDCPAGKVKKVKIKYGYRQAYNKQYHKWRSGQGGAVTGRIAKGERGA